MTQIDELEKVDQTTFGPQGNCQSACLSMLTGVSLSEIPNFAQIAFEQNNDNAADKAQTVWLLENGWCLVTIVKWQALPWPPRHGYYIAGGTSKRGYRHGVIYKNGELWHDPHPDRTGIESVDDIDILYPLNYRQNVDARRWKRLKELAGYWQDGSQTRVILDQDDATRTALILVGNERFKETRYLVEGCGFDAALDSTWLEKL